MNQPDLFKLAQQGNVKAIAALLSRDLQPRGVVVKVFLRDHCLKILLASARPLEQKAFVRYVQRQMAALEPAAVEQVKVYSQQFGQEIPLWVQEFSLLPAQAQPIPVDRETTAIVQSKSNGAIVAQPDVQDAKDFWGTLRTFQMDSVFPYRDVLSSDLYRNHTVKLMLFLGLFPLLVNLVAEQTSLAQTAWLIGIYYASIWGVVLHNLIQPAQFSWRETVKCVLFTAFIGIPILLVFQRVFPFSLLYQGIGTSNFISRFVGFVLGVGLLEEVCKALPIYLLRPGKLSDPHTAAFYGAMSGLGFAIAEGAAYSLFYALGLRNGHLGMSSFVVANTIRFVSLPLFHAILAGIVGYFLGLAAINPSRRWAIIFIGVTIATLLHGCYNTVAGGVLGLLVVGFSILLFASYLRRSKLLVDEMQRAEAGSRRGSKVGDRSKV